MNCLIWILLLLGCSGSGMCGRNGCRNVCGSGCGQERHHGGCGGHRHGGCDCGCEGMGDSCGNRNHGGNPGRNAGGPCCQNDRKADDCGCFEEHAARGCGDCEDNRRGERGQDCDGNMTPPAWQDYPVLPRRENCDCND